LTICTQTKYTFLILLIFFLGLFIYLFYIFVRLCLAKSNFFLKKKPNQKRLKGCLPNIPLNQEKQTKQGIKD
jgi:hypothetical protein